MIKRLLISALIMLWMLPSYSQVLIEGSLRPLGSQATSQPPQQVVPGQVMRMDWQLGSDSWFSQPPLMPNWQVEGAIVLPSTEEEGNFSRRLGRNTISGVNRYYWVIPQQEGKLQIVAHDVWLKRAFESDAKRYRTPVLDVEVVLPEGVSDASHFFPAKDVEINQSLSSYQRLEVGDQIERRITLMAADTLGVMMPELEAEAVDERIQSYLAGVEVKNRLLPRGMLIGGQREESWVYRLNEEGELYLPEVEVVWWDLDAGQFQTSKLPAINIEVHPASNTGAEQVLRQSPYAFVQPMLIISLLVFMVYIAVYHRHRLVDKYKQINSLIRQSRGYIFIQLIMAVLIGTEKQSQSRYILWARRNQADLPNLVLPESDMLQRNSRLKLLSLLVKIQYQVISFYWRKKHSLNLPSLNS